MNILVTGGSRGIGRELCRQLVQRGVHVILTARRLEDAQVAAKAVGAAAAFQLDVTDPESISAAAEAVHAGHGSLDILVNNAGILLPEDQSILDNAEDLLHETLDTNAFGPLRVAQALVPLLHQGGRIVNVSSGGAQLSSPSNWSPAYCISKTMLNAITVHLAEALRPRGISVNAACPGWVRTDMGGPSADISVEEGASGLVWLCLDAPQNLTGRFVQDGKEIPW